MLLSLFLNPSSSDPSSSRCAAPRPSCRPKVPTASCLLRTLLYIPVNSLPNSHTRSESLRVFHLSAPPPLANKAGASTAVPPWPSTPDAQPHFKLPLYTCRTSSSVQPTVRPIFELSTPFGDSVPANESALDAHESPTPPKQPKNFARSKHKKKEVKWTKERVASDNTGSDCRVSVPGSSGASSSNSGSTSSTSHTSSPSQRQPKPPKTESNAEGKQKARLMAANFAGATGDSRRGVSSPRPKGRGEKMISARDLM